MSALHFPKQKAPPPRPAGHFASDTERKSKVPLYRPGKQPQWAGQSQDQQDDDQDVDDLVARRRAIAARKRDMQVDAPKHEHETLKQAADATVSEERLVKPEVIVEDSDQSLAPIDTSRLAVPEVVEDAEDDDEAEERRRRIRERLRKRKEDSASVSEAQPAETPVKREPDALEASESHAEESEESEEEEDDSDEDDMDHLRGPIHKPLFISKKDRATIAERERLEREELEVQEMARKRNEERKVEATLLVIEDLAREEKKVSRGITDDDNAEDRDKPDDTDNPDDPVELESWKKRELLRLKRDEEAAEAHLMEEEQLKARRLLSDEEIMRLNAMDPSKQKDPKGKMQYLQKYYHKGVFYLDEHEDVFKRDFTAATGVDADVDRSVLPEVMKVKKWGLKGRTKYTHLVDQDTTVKGQSPWAEAIPIKAKLAGTGPVDAAFKKRKRDS
mgnify:CR=1 FL=1